MENADRSNDSKQKVLFTFSRSLRRESHILTQHPDLLWQQLYNQLKWEDDFIVSRVDKEMRRRLQSSQLWANLKFPTLGSKAIIKKFVGHTDSVSCCAVSPDGKKIISGSADQTLKVWDVYSGTEQFTLVGHTGRINDCAFSPDGKLILSASADKTLKLWDTYTGKELRTLSGHVNAVIQCGFNNKGDRINSLDFNKTLWNWNTDRGTGSVFGFKLPIVPVESPDDQWVVRGNKQGYLEVGSTTHPYPLGAGHSPKISPDSTWLVFCEANSPVLRIVEAETGKLRHTLYGHSDYIHGCAISPDGEWIISASNDSTIRLWSPKTGILLSTLNGHTDKVLDCVITPDGASFVSASADHTLILWDRMNSTEPQTFTPATDHGRPIWGCGFHPDGHEFASSGGYLNRWETDTGRAITKIKTGNFLNILGCSYSPDGTKILCRTGDWKYHLINLTDQKIESVQGYIGKLAYITPDPKQSNHLDFAFSPNKRWLVYTSYLERARNHELVKWDLEKNEHIRIIKGKNKGMNVCAISPDGAKIVSNSAEGAFQMWDTASGKLISTYPGNANGIHSCIISPDMQWLISSDLDHSVFIRDFSSGKEVGRLEGHTSRISGCCMSPDSSMIITVSWDNTLRLWDAQNLKSIALIPLSGEIYCVATHPWHPTLASGGKGGSIFLYDLVGIEYQAIIVTVVKDEDGMYARCPRCQKDHKVQQDQLGKSMTCPTQNCNLVLKLNSFVIQKHDTKNEGWLSGMFKK